MSKQLDFMQTSALWAGLGIAMTAYATRSGLLALQAWTQAPRAFAKVRSLPKAMPSLSMNTKLATSHAP